MGAWLFPSLILSSLEDWKNGSAVEIRTVLPALRVELKVGKEHLLGSWRGQHLRILLCKGSRTPPAHFKCKGHSLQRWWPSGYQTPTTQHKEAKKTPHHAKTTTLVFVESLPTSVLFTKRCDESAWMVWKG